MKDDSLKGPAMAEKSSPDKDFVVPKPKSKREKNDLDAFDSILSSLPISQAYKRCRKEEDIVDFCLERQETIEKLKE